MFHDWSQKSCEGHHQEKIGKKEANLDWAKIVVNAGVTWRTCPAEVQFWNRASEAVVKKAKRTFHHIYWESKLIAFEMETTLKRIAAILSVGLWQPTTNLAMVQDRMRPHSSRSIGSH